MVFDNIEHLYVIDIINFEFYSFKHLELYPLKHLINCDIITGDHMEAR
jgi:hypothetical protein